MQIDPLAELIGVSPAMATVRRTLQRLLDSQARARRPVPILLLGETGVGKSLVARVLHRAGPRADRPFVDVNCAAIPEPLLEAELFGFERGAFTDAKQTKPGLLQEAHGGTLFLDEVGLLPEGSQAKLLKALEEGTVRRLGGTRSQPVDTWIIAATSEDLEEASRRRRFRSDLYHRLAVITVRLPALRERPEDIVLLGEQFLREACAEAGLPAKTLTAEARAALREYAWPGNIRELKNVVTRAALLAETPELPRAALELPPGVTRPTEPRTASSRDETLPEAEVDVARIVPVLRETGWNVSRAAARLGLTRRALRYRIEKWNLSPERPAAPAGIPITFGAPRPGPPAMPALPVPVTSWIGRERELRGIALRLTTHRVVTLTGPGGVGKTRLALAVGPQLRGLCPDGVWFVELASVGEGGLVAQTVVSALGLPEEAPRSPLEILIAALTGRQALLILDNCEHVIGACAELAETLVRACPRLRVLATSRERLDIAGESTFRVPSLALPGEGEHAAEQLARTEAVRLFVERARLVDPDFGLTERNAAAVVELCRRLDGLPLALELAAARVRFLSIEQIVARLSDRFRLLTGGGRTTIARQQTLRAALDWSHDLLSPPERTLLRRLSVFTGGFTLEAVEAVCSGAGVECSQMLDLLAELVDKSLVIVETAAPVARYRLLETIWEYGREQAIAAGEVAWLRERHQAWCIALAEEADLRGRRGEDVTWFDRLETEYDNLQAALNWRDQDRAGDTPRLRLAGALWRFWDVRGRIQEGRGWLEHILAETGRGAPGARARALNGAGNLARSLGEYGRAVEHHAEALALRREIGDALGVAASLNNLGEAAHDQGAYSAAEAYFTDALHAVKQVGDRFGVAVALTNLGRTRRFQGDYDSDGAGALGREGLALFRALANSWGMALALNSLANTAHYRGDLKEARPLYEESLRLRRHVGDHQGIGVSLNGLALVCGLAGDLETGRRLAEESLVLRRDLGDRRGIGGSLWTFGRLALWGRDLEEADRLTRESLAIRAQLDDRLGIACCLELLADVAFEQGQHTRAVRLLGAAAAERKAIGAPRPPREGEHHERLMVSLRDRLGERSVELAWIEARPGPVVAGELKAATGRTAGVPRPSIENLTPGARPGVSSSRPTAQER